MCLPHVSTVASSLPAALVCTLSLSSRQSSRRDPCAVPCLFLALPRKQRSTLLTPYPTLLYSTYVHSWYFIVLTLRRVWTLKIVEAFYGEGNVLKFPIKKFVQL